MSSGAYVLDGLSEISSGHHILGIAFQAADGPIPASMKVPKQHHIHKRKAPMCSKTPKDMERYQALLMHWFREELTLGYKTLSGEKAEQALQALMTATVDITLQHPLMENISGRMEPHPTGSTGTSTIHRRTPESFREFNTAISMASTQMFR
jgi:hypothetical protein